MLSGLSPLLRLPLLQGLTREALLRMDPEPQRVVFDTVLETPTGTFFVRGGEDE